MQWFLVLVIAVTGPAWMATSPRWDITRAEMVGFCDELDYEVNGTAFTFTSEYFSGVGYTPGESTEDALVYPFRGPPLLGETSLRFPRDSKLYSALWTTVYMHGKFRAELEYTYAHFASKARQEALGIRRILTWDRIQAREKSIHLASSRAVTGRILVAPSANFYIEQFGAWHGWWLFQRPEQASLGELFDHGHLLDSWINLAAESCWRFQHPFRGECHGGDCGASC